MPTSDDENLARYFSALERESTFEVEATLKESPNELTQRVCFIGADAATRVPLIRKFIRRESGLGAAYERLHAAQTAGRRFKHVPLIWECYSNAENLVVVMELISGESLTNHVERLGASVELAANVFPQLCDAVSELHEELDPPLIHRDLKPSNVIVAQQGLYVIDFGIARSFHEGARADTTHFGTCSFAPPEQFGFGQTTVRSDIFALGMMLFYCLAGFVPDTYVAAEDFARGNIPAPLQTVIMRACALSPDERYANAHELKQAFQEAAGALPAPAGDFASECTAGTLPAPSVEQGRTPNNASPANPTGNRMGTDSGIIVDEDLKPTNPAGNHRRADRFTNLGKVWNGVLIALVAFLCAACVGAFIDPGESTIGNPTWVNALGYLFFMPTFFIAGAWALADKRRVAQRFPRLNRFRFWHWLIMFVAVSFTLFLGVGLVVIIGQAA